MLQKEVSVRIWVNTNIYKELLIQLVVPWVKKKETVRAE
jgi:hypothetical protein